METLVYKVFKALMISMIMVFVFDISMYLIKANTLKRKVENIMSSMQDVVSENNYLPPESYEMYKTLFIQLMNEMNGESGTTLKMRPASTNKWFFSGLQFNYNHDPVNCLSVLQVKRNGSNINALARNMAVEAKYGDIMIVQAKVQVEQPNWFYSGALNNEAGLNKKTAKNDVPHTEFYFTYYVPCLKFKRAV